MRLSSLILSFSDTFSKAWIIFVNLFTTSLNFQIFKIWLAKLNSIPVSGLPIPTYLLHQPFCIKMGDFYQSLPDFLDIFLFQESSVNKNQSMQKHFSKGVNVFYAIPLHSKKPLTNSRVAETWRPEVTLVIQIDIQFPFHHLSCHLPKSTWATKWKKEVQSRQPNRNRISPSGMLISCFPN